MSAGMGACIRDGVRASGFASLHNSSEAVGLHVPHRSLRFRCERAQRSTSVKSENFDRFTSLSHATVLTSSIYFYLHRSFRKVIERPGSMVG